MKTEVKISIKETKNKVSKIIINIDPKICAQYFRLTLEMISFLGTTYPIDAKKNPTKMK